MLRNVSKKIIIPVFASALLLVTSAFKDDFFEIAKQIEIYTNLFKTLNTNYVDELNPAEVMNKGIQGMLNSLDPYTVFFNEQDVLNFKINNTGEYTGIGAIITRKADKLIIREPFKDFPADKAGLKAGDEITQIGDILLSDYKDDTSQLFKGIKNTKVSVQFLRQGKPMKTDIILDEVAIKSVPFFAKIDEQTGYIALTHFNQKASIETKEALEKLKADGAQRIVLDLRGNPGGLLNEAVNICNLFVPKNEIIVTTKSKNEKNNFVYKTTKEPVDTNIPLVIIVNGRSASASEIVSGALQDLDRAVIIGSRSFGKGLVQKPIDLNYGTQLKVTISRYFTPSGRCIQALDYANKDKNGAATRKEAKNYNAFKTKNGRTVFDGGGILPDLELVESKPSSTANALQKNDAIFMYANHFYAKNASLSNYPTLSNNDFEDFKNYLKSKNINLETETQVALKNTLAIAKKEQIDQNIAKEYDQLLAAIKRNEDALLNQRQKEILQLLQDEIIKRYAYQDGLYQYYLKNNPEILKAVELLNQPTKMAEILTTKK